VTPGASSHPLGIWRGATGTVILAYSFFSPKLIIPWTTGYMVDKLYPMLSEECMLRILGNRSPRGMRMESGEGSTMNNFRVCTVPLI
jgi:hypothetical protein